MEDFIAKLIRMVEVDLQFYGAKQGNIQEQTRGTALTVVYCYSVGITIIYAINDCLCMYDPLLLCVCTLPLLLCVDMILMHVDSMAGLRKELKRLPISKVRYQPTRVQFCL